MGRPGAGVPAARGDAALARTCSSSAAASARRRTSSCPLIDVAHPDRAGRAAQQRRHRRRGHDRGRYLTGCPASRRASLTSPIAARRSGTRWRPAPRRRPPRRPAGSAPAAPAPPLAITGTSTTAPHGADQLQVEAVLGAVGVHRVEQDLPRAELARPRRPTRPRRCRCPGARRGWSPRTRSGSVRRRRPGGRPPTARAPARRTAAAISASSSGRAMAAVFTPTLSAPARSSRVHIGDRADAAADGERDEHLLGGAADHVDMVSRPPEEAVMSRKISSSAPSAS